MSYIHGDFKGIKDLWNPHISVLYTPENGKELLHFAHKGNRGYVLYKELETGMVTIDIAMPIKISSNLWSYKIYNESSHPLYYQCLQTMLNQSTNMHPRAVEWRAACLEKHGYILNKRKIQNYLKDLLNKGMLIKSQKYGEIEFLEFTKSTEFLGFSRSHNREFRYRLGLFPLNELEDIIS